MHESGDFRYCEVWGLTPYALLGRSGFNRWAAVGDAETFTKKINGGQNGLPDRFDQLARISLVLVGYRADYVLQLQEDQRLDVDGDMVPKTRPRHAHPDEATRPEVKVAPAVKGEPLGPWLPGHGLSQL